MQAQGAAGTPTARRVHGQAASCHASQPWELPSWAWAEQQAPVWECGPVGSPRADEGSGGPLARKGMLPISEAALAKGDWPFRLYVSLTSRPGLLLLRDPAKVKDPDRCHETEKQEH